MDCGAVVLVGHNVEIEGVLLRKTAPGPSGCDQVSHWIDLIFGAERAPCIGGGLAKRQKRVMHFLPAYLIPVRCFEATGTVLADFDRILQSMDLFQIISVRRIN